jgi:hypothetical protein
MCTGLEALAFGTTALGTVQQLRGQEQVAEAQQKQLVREAQLTQTQAASKKAAIRKDAERLAGAQRVAIGKSGVQASGSVMDVMKQSAEDAELAILTAQYGADLASEARQEEAQAVTENLANRRTSTLLQGVGGIFGQLL